MSIQGQLPALGAILGAFGILCAPTAPSAAATSTPAFIVTLARGVAAQSHTTAEQPPSEVLDGRVYVIVSRHANMEPRLQGPPGMDMGAAPIWGIDVDGVQAGSRIELHRNDPRIFGFPLALVLPFTLGWSHPPRLHDGFEQVTLRFTIRDNIGISIIELRGGGKPSVPGNVVTR